ncbi:ROK family transcriptional regulator [Ornithinimicrobium cavernae]|uniref:ROK family transcriptional regulator n=1 Tax=Ornithinimicrobium cavernae TaxID=2666047 RepID=UPI00137A1BF3|nr:ROK family transcriptional regulator [Ornithinimicrobium cavernae]
MVGAGILLELLRDDTSLTRAQIVARSGLSRVTVTQRLNALVEAGYVVVQPSTARTGGRPAEVLALNPHRGRLLAADVGSSHARLGLADLTGKVVDHLDLDLNVDDGPDPVLSTLDEAFSQLLAQSNVEPATVLGVGVGMPGPVEYSTGRLVSPPTMNGWDGVDVRAHFARSFGAPVQVDKDANIIALGVQRVLDPPVEDVLVVKVGMGIGCGIISRGAILRGAHGAAGDLGHIPRPGGELCRCGQHGCAEATAGGWAIAARLRDSGHADVHSSADIVALASRRDAQALALLRAAGQRLGEVIAEAIGVVNPALVVVAGDLARAEEPLMAGVRERVYQRSHPLATRDLQIITSPLGAEAGLRGAAYLASDVALEPSRIDAALTSFA